MSQTETGAHAPTEVEKFPVPEHSRIQHTIAVMSGKGGVGKSTVSALLASALSRQGYKIGILDADVTGPSIPRMFGMKTPPGSNVQGIMPPRTKSGIKIMSLNLILKHEDDPVIWRGPLISSVIRQFWNEVVWGDLDYLVVDLPPGTGDVPLTVLQSLPLDGLIVVSSPQELALMVVRKAVNMAALMEVPVLGLVDNMSVFRCPHCGTETPVFGAGHVDTLGAENGIPVLGHLPLDPQLSRLADSGDIERYDVEFLAAVPDLINRLGRKEG